VRVEVGVAWVAGGRPDTYPHTPPPPPPPPTRWYNLGVGGGCGVVSGCQSRDYATFQTSSEAVGIDP
jgi:hypothetical protein